MRFEIEVCQDRACGNWFVALRIVRDDGTCDVVKSIPSFKTPREANEAVAAQLTRLTADIGATGEDAGRRRGGLDPSHWHSEGIPDLWHS